MEVKSLPEKYREFLKQPFGILLSSSHSLFTDLQPILKNSDFIITVGDATSENLFQLGIKVNLQIIDLMEKRRKRTFPKLAWTNKVSINNPAGTLSTESLSLVCDMIKAKTDTLIIVNGEEDLFTLPAILFAPVGTSVLYGQPDEGLVVVSVNNSLKTTVRNILIEMDFDENILKY